MTEIMNNNNNNNNNNNSVFVEDKKIEMSTKVLPPDPLPPSLSVSVTSDTSSSSSVPSLSPTIVSSDSTAIPSTNDSTLTSVSPLIVSPPASFSSSSSSSAKVMEAFPYTCPLCLDEFQERRPLYRVVGCRHLYCQNCIVAYYSQSIQDHKRVVKCPSPSCEKEILFCNVKNILDVPMLIKFQRLSLKFPENQKNISIWCPGDGCKAKIYRQKSKELGSVPCLNCKLRVCFKCGEWEHPGTGCEGSEQLTELKKESENKQKAAFEQWKQESGVIVKTCPKCGAVIERDGGCSHMTCKACQHQFCFICLQPCKATHCR